MQTGDDPGDEMRKAARHELVGQARQPINGKWIELIDSIRRDKEQKIDHESLDELVRAEWSADTVQHATDLVNEFKQLLVSHKNELTALEIFFDQPYNRREVTYSMIREVMEVIKQDKPALAPVRVWSAFAQLDDYTGKQPQTELGMLVALIRRVCGIDSTLASYESTVRKNFRDWIMKRHAGAGQKFNEAQMNWLQMIRDHISSSFHFEREDLEMAPFDSRGGLGRMHQLFGSGMDDLINEMNEELAA